MTDSADPKETEPTSTDAAPPEEPSDVVAEGSPTAESAELSAQSEISPGAESSPGSESSPGEESSPGGESSPGEESSPGSESSPGTLSAESSAGSEASPEGEKKRRRRRRRKKKGAPVEGEASAAPAEPVKKKDPSHLPFQRFFEGAARRHAFSVGEIVAGRVMETREDVAVVDLFGKATAYSRLHEPRAIPVAPEPPPEEAEASEEHPVEEASVEAPVEEAALETESSEQTLETPSTETPIEAHAPEGEGEHADEVHDSEAPDGPPIEPSYKITPEGEPALQAGEICRGRVGAVAESGHIALVNEIIDVKATRAILKRARDDRSRVTGLVFGFNRGGFDVLVYGLRAFCPVSGMVLEPIDDPHPQLGQWAQFHVQTARAGTQGLVVSRRSILEKESRKKARALLKTLEPGQRVKGRVTQVREYGLFVDIGGVEGLVHQSELSWERGVRPEDVASPGDEVEVQVIKVHERESKRERHDRVSLSLRALAPDPWQEQADQLREGQPRRGLVVRTAEFGAFIQLAPGMDGLLHISELGRDLKHADQAVKEGDEIHVVIERVDKKQRRISLSKLSAEDAALFDKGELTETERAPRLKPGGYIKVRVAQVVPAGLHVQVENVVGKRGRGFIPNSEMGTPRGTDHRRQWPPGTEIDVKIIGTDRDGGLRCSRKGFLIDEERRAVRDYKKEVEKKGLGTFGDILRQKLGLGSER